MSDRTPGEDTVLHAIALANRAPSVHNTQPWRWLLGDGLIHLVTEPARYLPATDPDGRDLLLSCGAALHHLRVALASLGWRATVHHLPDTGEPTHLATVEMAPKPPSTADIELAAAIDRRRTDRRRFTSWPVPGGHLELMATRAADAGALLVPVTDQRTRRQLAHAIDRAAVLQEDDLAYEDELTAWTGRDPLAQDGVLAASTPLVPATHGDTTMRRFRPGTLPNAETGRGEPDGGELLVLATATDDLVSVLRAGEAASAALLAATEAGLATCPLSQALEVADTRGLIRTQVLKGTAYPHLILRSGWAPTAAPPPPRSPRRGTSATVSRLPGTGPVPPQ
jgi:nitroreductase